MGLLRRHPVLTALVVVVVLAAVGVAALVVAVDEPGPASVDDVIERFEDDRAGGPGGPDGSRPAEGVYLYAGEGEERLSFPPLDQADSAEMPATVVHRGRDCWAFRIDYNANHWQEWTLCRDDGRVVETGGRTGQEWDLGAAQVGNVSSFACDPPSVVLDPDAEPGDEIGQSCSGTNSAIDGTTTSAGTARVVGIETLLIGGAEVEVVHLRGTRTLTGAQEGDERTEAWFRGDGLLVRYERDIEVRTESPVGPITYTEEGHFVLTQVQPRR